MVKLLTSFTLSVLLAVLTIGSAQADEQGIKVGPRRQDKSTPVRREVAVRAATSAAAADPWANFKQFSWNYWATNYGWSGHTLDYVKAWYLDYYDGFNLPQGVQSWAQLSYYVNYFGTYAPQPKPSISVYGKSNTEAPWEFGQPAASTTSKAPVPSSTSTTSSASSSSSKASSTSSAAAVSSSSIASSTSSAKASSTSSSAAAASSSAVSLTGGVTTTNGWTSQGCFSDSYNPHYLDQFYLRADNMTQEYCGSLCYSQGRSYMAVEYGSDCYCANALSSGSQFSKLADSSCNMACAGNSKQNCGGYYTLVMFKYTGSAALPVTSSAAASSSSSSSSASRAASSSSSSSAAASSSSSSSVAASSSSSSSAAASSSSSSSVAASSSSSSSAAASSSSSSSAAASSSSSSSIASSSTSSSTSSAAPTPTAPAIPSGWRVADVPCIADGKTGRALLGSFTIDYNNTIESCLAKCDSQGYPIAGIEYGNQCFCGSYLSNGASIQNTATCAVACPGNKLETCGGYYAMSLFVSTKINGAILNPDLSSVTAKLPDGWSTVAKCMPDVNGRALTGWSSSEDGMTVPLCLTKCALQGYQYGAVEYGRECYCGNTLDNGADLTKTSALCGTPCAGNPTTSCGGWNSMQVFNNPAYSFSNTIVNGYVKTACLQEVAGRALKAASYKDEVNMTVDSCTSYCAERGLNLAALEYGSECYCGSALTGGASLLLTSGECKMQCAGDDTQGCGGPNAMWLYINPKSLVSSVNLPTGWSYKGCISEGSQARALSYDASDLVKKGGMTGEICAQQCATLGYNMAGTEYAVQCYCGNSFSGGATGAIIDTVLDGSTGQCNRPCPGNSAQMCGGAFRLSLYSNLATLPSIPTLPSASASSSNA